MADVWSGAAADADTIKYNGCVIACRLYKLEATDNWSAQVLIRHGQRAGSFDARFTSNEAWLSRDEALRHAIQFGKRVVDGYIPDLTWEHDILEA